MMSVGGEASVSAEAVKRVAAFAEDEKANP